MKRLNKLRVLSFLVAIFIVIFLLHQTQKPMKLSTLEMTSYFMMLMIVTHHFLKSVKTVSMADLLKVLRI